jgi:gamma-glutamylcyclotransferase (GGCT)/AIG2-like uncharacterized protein YtfP
MSDVRYNVFVYGSLKEGLPLHGVLSDADFIGQYSTAPDFLLYDFDSFPGMHPVDAGKGQQVQGEVYSIDEDTLHYLDIVEGVHRGLYKRISLNVYDREGAPIRVFAFVWPRKSCAPTVTDGVWNNE